MLIFLDESGDLGFNFANKGTSNYFIITVLVCPSKFIADQINQAIKRTLRNKLPLSTSFRYEVKGMATSLPVKKYFYRLHRHKK